MDAAERVALLSFLTTGSHTSLGSFVLARLDRSSRTDKQIRKLQAQQIEDLAMVYLANLIREHGAELISAGPHKVEALPASTKEKRRA